MRMAYAGGRQPSQQSPGFKSASSCVHPVLHSEQQAALSSSSLLPHSPSTYSDTGSGTRSGLILGHGSKGGIAAWRWQQPAVLGGMLGNFDNMVHQCLGPDVSQLLLHHTQAVVHMHQVWSPSL